MTKKYQMEKSPLLNTRLPRAEVPPALQSFNHDTGEVDVDKAVYFLHFFGGKLEENLQGKAVSVSTVIKNLKYQEFHNKLADAFA